MYRSASWNALVVFMAFLPCYLTITLFRSLSNYYATYFLVSCHEHVHYPSLFAVDRNTKWITKAFQRRSRTIRNVPLVSKNSSVVISFDIDIIVPTSIRNAQLSTIIIPNFSILLIFCLSFVVGIYTILHFLWLSNRYSKESSRWCGWLVWKVLLLFIKRSKSFQTKGARHKKAPFPWQEGGENPGFTSGKN